MVLKMRYRLFYNVIHHTSFNLQLLSDTIISLSNIHANNKGLELYGCQETSLDIAAERRADDFSVSPLMTLWIQGKYEEILI